MLNETEMREIESRLKFAIKNGHIGSVGFVLVEKDIPALLSTVRELQRQVQELEAWKNTNAVAPKEPTP